MGPCTLTRVYLVFGCRARSGGWRDPDYEVAASLFKSLDTNNDGLISKDELCEHFYSAMHGFSEPNPAMQLQMAQRIGISCEAFTPKLTEEIGERMECQCMLM